MTGGALWSCLKLSNRNVFVGGWCCLTKLKGNTEWYALTTHVLKVWGGLGLPQTSSGLIFGPSAVCLPATSRHGQCSNLFTAEGPIPFGLHQHDSKNHILWFLKCIQHHPTSPAKWDDG